MTLEDYLRANCERAVIDHKMRARVCADGTVEFYIHADGTDSDTLDFKVRGDQLDCQRALPLP